MRTVLLTCCGLLIAGTARADETPGELAVMSFNIRYDNPNDGPNAWPHRAEWVADIIQDNSDIAGLQEVRKNQLDQLKELLPDYSFYGVGRDDGKEAGEYVPVAWRSDRFSLVDKGVFWLSETPSEPSKSWDSSLKRVTTWVRLKEKESGKTLLVVNTHFDHRGEVARRRTGALLRQWIAEHRGDDPVLLTGDFNTLPDSEPYKQITKEQGGTALSDARLAVDAPEGPESTWNGFKKIVPGRRIDFVFTAGPVEVKTFRTLTEQRDGRFSSDHCPIVAGVAIAGGG